MITRIKFTQQNTEWQALNSEFTKLDHKILDYFINRCRMKWTFRASYQTIADSIKCHEKTVRRAVNKFISMGLMSKSIPRFMDICDFFINKGIYKFADYFRYKFNSLKKHYNLGRKVDYLKKLKQNVRPLCSNLLSKILIPRNSYIVDNQYSKNIKRGDFLTKREEMEVSPPTISPTLREITEKLHLNRLGQLKLKVIPDDILSSVWNHCKKMSGIKDPFGLLMANCLKQAENKGIIISWELFYLALKRYKLEDNKKYTLPKPIVTNTPSVVVTVIHRPYADKKEPNPKFAEFYFKAMENMIE